MNHLSFGRKEGRGLGNKNTIFSVSGRVFNESFFDITTSAAAAGTVGGFGVGRTSAPEFVTSAVQNAGRHAAPIREAL
jgi:hypothetical protein